MHVIPSEESHTKLFGKRIFTSLRSERMRGTSDSLTGRNSSFRLCCIQNDSNVISNASERSHANTRFVGDSSELHPSE